MKAINIMSLILIFVILSSIIIAHNEDVFAEAEEIIASKIHCAQLGESQLESIGDYYMEQMHPGELHERMDRMIGVEGSESLRQVHINMAKTFYCGEHGAMPGNMMNTMMGRGGMMNFGMMGNWGYGGIFQLLWLLLGIGLVMLVYLWIWKLWKDRGTKK